MFRSLDFGNLLLNFAKFVVPFSQPLNERYETMRKANGERAAPRQTCNANFYLEEGGKFKFLTR